MKNRKRREENHDVHSRSRRNKSRKFRFEIRESLRQESNPGQQSPKASSLPLPNHRCQFDPMGFPGLEMKLNFTSIVPKPCTNAMFGPI